MSLSKNTTLQNPVVFIYISELGQKPVNDASLILALKVFNAGFREFHRGPELFEEFIERLDKPAVFRNLDIYFNDIIRDARNTVQKSDTFFKVMHNIKYITDYALNHCSTADAEYVARIKPKVFHINQMHRQVMSQISLIDPRLFKDRYFKSWSGNNSPDLISEIFKNEQGVWRMLADPFLAGDVFGKHKISRFTNTFKHAKIKDGDLFSYWTATLDRAKGNSSVITTPGMGVSRMRAFWFKHALRQKLKFSDIASQDPKVANFLLQSAAALYIQKTDPMVGNFVNVVVPRLRESIDS